MPPTALHRPDPASAVAIIRERFLCRTDLVCGRAPWGKPCPVLPGNDEELEALLRAHVMGEAISEALARFTWQDRETRVRRVRRVVGRFRIGTYCPSPEGQARWVCLDFDGAGHANALADPLAAALAAYREGRRVGLACHLEKSGGGSGWHLWVFIDSPANAAAARALGLAIAPRDAALSGGGMADPRAGRGIEVFPKSVHLRRGGVGSPVWLPWWHAAPAGANLFYRVARSNGRLSPYLPADFEAVDARTLERALAALGFDLSNPLPGRPARSVRPTLGTSLALSSGPHGVGGIPPGPCGPRGRAWQVPSPHPAPVGRRGVLYYAFEGRGWIHREASPGKWIVRCPWAHAHTKGSRVEGSAVLFAPEAGQQLGCFRCSHAHCTHRGLRDLLDLFGTDEIECARALAGVAFLPSGAAPARCDR